MPNIPIPAKKKRNVMKKRHTLSTSTFLNGNDSEEENTEISSVILPPPPAPIARRSARISIRRNTILQDDTPQVIEHSVKPNNSVVLNRRQSVRISIRNTNCCKSPAKKPVPVKRNASKVIG